MVVDLFEIDLDLYMTWDGEVNSTPSSVWARYVKLVQPHQYSWGVDTPQ